MNIAKGYLIKWSHAVPTSKGSTRQLKSGRRFLLFRITNLGMPPLFPTRILHTMNDLSRKEKGREIAALYNLTKEKGFWKVPSSKGNKSYRVSIFGKKSFCTCLDYETRGEKCKHIYAVEFRLANPRPVGRPRKKPTELRPERRKTYSRDWRAYNEAQTMEGQIFPNLLHELCKDLVIVDSSRGRPRIPLSDALFAIIYKVYTGLSGRRFISDLHSAVQKGYISSLPHFNTLFNYLEDSNTHSVLMGLLRSTNYPFRDLESKFAVDSTGFSSHRYTRWFDHKFGKPATQKDWVKAHFMCGVDSHIVTALEISEESFHDSPLFPALLETTATMYEIEEVSGDKAYTSMDNMKAVVDEGGTPYFAFKSNATGLKGGIWSKMYYMFMLHREKYLKHYHQRSNVESAVQMVKSKFGSSVFSKSDVAMKNEVVCKFICHNIYCTVQAIYNLGLDPKFERVREEFLERVA